jgi:hypothetical protein
MCGSAFNPTATEHCCLHCSTFEPGVAHDPAALYAMLQKRINSNNMQTILDRLHVLSGFERLDLYHAAESPDRQVPVLGELLTLALGFPTAGRPEPVAGGTASAARAAVSISHECGSIPLETVSDDTPEALVGALDMLRAAIATPGAKVQANLSVIINLPRKNLCQ